MKQSIFRYRHGWCALRDRAAFTLAELLVVIAIVGMLMSI
ncbi:MAG: type II secretion system protein [Lentisphaerae bacterium]|nr:type II secretion system protein [Lentisphaerota bacterium]